ncbi:MAG: endonuclease III [Myxococcales bacterium]|nr:endonuclease III [Myxococcales bacterium]
MSACRGEGAACAGGRPVMTFDMTRQEKADRIARTLDELYPAPPIPLDHADPFTLLVAVMLSAQATDKKVNEVSPGLFALAPDARRMAALEVAQILERIRAIGLAPTKAKNLKRMAELLLERHGGEVPASLEALEALPGVGHKTASVVMSQAFGVPAFPVDTHIHRLAKRWGLTEGRNVAQTERDLKKVFAEPTWNRRHLQIIYFGREHCPARGHDLEACPICSWAASRARIRAEAEGRGAVERRGAAKRGR